MGHILAAVQVALGALTAAGALAAFSSICLFYAGCFEYISIDVVSPWQHPSLLSSSPLLNNIFLLLIFYLPHSIAAREGFKSLFSFLSPSAYRQLYCLKTILSLFLIIYGWSPQPQPVWQVQWIPLRYTLYGFGVLGIVMNRMAIRLLNPLALYGIQKPLEKLTGASPKPAQLVTSGVYSIVRHPMYTGLVIAMWTHPTMSEGRLLICVTSLLYLLVAVPYFEEVDLIKQFGQEYKNYIQKTPMLFPLPSVNGHKTE